MIVQDRVIGRRLVSSEGMSDNILSLSVNQTKFNFTLESRQILGFSYNDIIILFTVKPPSTIIANNDSATLVLSYNLQYNVAVTVFGTMDACGYYDSKSTTLTLSYGENIT